MRHEFSSRWIFAGAGDCENRFALQQLQGIGCPLCAFFFHDGQDFVFKIRLAHVKERLARHCGVLHALFFGHQCKHGFHQRALSRR
jgi:hypothetical protein